MPYWQFAFPLYWCLLFTRQKKLWWSKNPIAWEFEKGRCKPIYIYTHLAESNGLRRALLAEGHPVQYIYDKLLDESGGLLKSKSKSSEPRGKRQIYSQIAKRRWEKRQIYSQNAKRKRQGNNIGEDDDDLSDLLRQLKSINVVESIVIKKICYFYLVTTEKQTNDISTFW